MKELEYLLERAIAKFGSFLISPGMLLQNESANILNSSNITTIHWDPHLFIIQYRDGPFIRFLFYIWIFKGLCIPYINI